MPQLHNKKTLTPRRRHLRKQGTPAEAALWKLLQRRQLAGRKFRRQHSVERYILDFYCPAEMLAIELDGDVHNDPFRAVYDAERERFLTAQGIRVVRFENEAVFKTPDLVCAAIETYFTIQPEQSEVSNHPAPLGHPSLSKEGS